MTRQRDAFEQACTAILLLMEDVPKLVNEVKTLERTLLGDCYVDFAQARAKACVIIPDHIFVGYFTFCDWLRTREKESNHV